VSHREQSVKIVTKAAEGRMRVRNAFCDHIDPQTDPEVGRNRPTCCVQKISREFQEFLTT
ncbi:MAG TPA: hypothetical protein VMQ86_01405, partial [Bryobacteraceae bacterium]|nr:hypothetical protein [Bryobacteraceae bacterium]